MSPSEKGSGIPAASERWEVAVRRAFVEAKRERPSDFSRKIDLSWSIWMFGTEAIGKSFDRLARNGLGFVEVKGDRFSPGEGVPTAELRRRLADSALRVSGACGMFSRERDLSSPEPAARRAAQDYVRREIGALAELGARYLIVVPAAVGRPESAGPEELARSAAALRELGGEFAAAGIAAAVEPIRSAEVSIVHTVAEALAYLGLVGHPGVGCVNGDVYHMHVEGERVGEAVLLAGERLVNLHLADTNRDGLGRGDLDLDTVIMAAYLVGMNREGRFLTPEPLGPHPDPYVLANGPCDEAVMDSLVADTVAFFREREEAVRRL